MIPSDWKAVNGMLSAPRRLYTDGNIAQNTCLVVARYPGVSIAGVVESAYCEPGGFHGPGEKGYKDFQYPDICGVVLAHLMPSSVEFELAGLDAMPVRLNAVRDIAAGFLKEGYRGSLTAYKSFDGDNYDDNAARLSLDCKEIHLVLEWNPDFGGKEDDIASLIQRAEGFGLQVK